MTARLWLPFAAILSLVAACAPPQEESSDAKATSRLTGSPAVLANDAAGPVRAAVTGSVGLVAWQSAGGVSAQLVDAAGAPLGSVLSLGGTLKGFAVAAGNGTFAVVNGGNPLTVRRIDANGTLLDAAWAPLTGTYGGLDTVHDVEATFDGSQFVVDFVVSHPDANYSHDDLRTLTVPTTGPLTPVAGTGLQGGAALNLVLETLGVACNGAACARLFSRGCGGPSCLLPTSQQGLIFSAGGAETQLYYSVGIFDSRGALATDGSQLLVTATSCGDVFARRFGYDGLPIGNSISVAGRPGVSQLTSTFDGNDFAVAWKLVGAGAVDIYANWVSPAGAVAFPSADPAAASPGVDDSPSLAPLGGGSALLATRSGPSVETRVLTKGVGVVPPPPSSPPQALPDGAYGANGVGAIGASGQSAMILSKAPDGSLHGSIVDGQLHVQDRVIGTGASPTMAVAASGNGFLGAVVDNGAVAIRRFDATGAPVDATWTQLPYGGCSDPSAGFNGTDYVIYFGGTAPTCGSVCNARRLVIPATGSLANLPAAAVLGTNSLKDASCSGAACVAVAWAQSKQLAIYNALGGTTLYNTSAPVGEAAIAMGPSEGLLVFSADSLVYAQRLNQNGVPTAAPPMLIGGTISSGGGSKSLSVVHDGQRYAVVWRTEGGSYNIDGNWVDANGPVYSSEQHLFDELGDINVARLAPAGGGQAFITFGIGSTPASAAGQVTLLDPSDILVYNDVTPLTIGPPSTLAGPSSNAYSPYALAAPAGALAFWLEPGPSGQNPSLRATRVDLTGAALDVPSIDLGQVASGRIAAAFSGNEFGVFDFTDNSPYAVSGRRLDLDGHPLGPWVQLKTFASSIYGTVSAAYNGSDFVLLFGFNPPRVMHVAPPSLALISDAVVTTSKIDLDLLCSPPDCYFGYAKLGTTYLQKEQGSPVQVSTLSKQSLVLEPTGPTVVLEDQGLIYGAQYDPTPSLLQSPSFQITDWQNEIVKSVAYDDVSILLALQRSSSGAYIRSLLPGSVTHRYPGYGLTPALTRMAPGTTLALSSVKNPVTKLFNLEARVIHHGCALPSDCASGHCAGSVCCAVNCDDGDACTTDTCAPSGAACAHTPVADGESCSGGTCQQGTCVPNGGTSSSSSSSGVGGAGGASTTSSSGVGGASTTSSSGVGGAGGASTTSSSGVGGASTTSSSGVGGASTTSSSGVGGASTTSSSGVGGAGGASTTSSSGTGGSDTTTSSSGVGGASTTSSSGTGGSDTTTSSSGVGGAGGASTTSSSGVGGASTTSSSGVGGAGGASTTSSSSGVGGAGGASTTSSSGTGGSDTTTSSSSGVGGAGGASTTSSSGTGGLDTTTSSSSGVGGAGGASTTSSSGTGGSDTTTGTTGGAGGTTGGSAGSDTGTSGGAGGTGGTGGSDVAPGSCSCRLSDRNSPGTATGALLALSLVLAARRRKVRLALSRTGASGLVGAGCRRRGLP